MISQTIIDKSIEALENCDALVIGAGAGLSTAGGLHYSGERFTKNFPDFIEKYGLTDMYSSVFYPFPSLEERWAYLSRHIALNHFDAEVGQVYYDLLKLVEGKDYFVFTTNGDGLFFKAGFDPERIFACQGDYKLLQCEQGCHKTLYNNEELVRKMIAQQVQCKVPSELVPFCPKCGARLVPHLRIDQNFVENEEWQQGQKRYNSFLGKMKGKRFLFLELGIGYNTPTIIRWPFEQMTMLSKTNTLIRVNKDETEPRFPMSDRFIAAQGDINEFMTKMV